MPFPKADPAAGLLFEQLVVQYPDLERRKMFGHPCAFLGGNLCVGMFGSEIFLRLGPEDRRSAARLRGVRPFAPMPERPMREYLVFPPSILRDPRHSRRWLDRSVKFTATLPPK